MHHGFIPPYPSTNRHLRGVNQEKHRAQARPKPPPHPNRPRHADGRTVPPLLGPGAIKRRTPRTGLSPGARETLKRALIAFRDSAGKLGLIDEFCAHRGVSLYFGRNEEGGLRCPYHGWKYDNMGHCLEVPSEPEDSNFRKK